MKSSNKNRFGFGFQIAMLALLTTTFLLSKPGMAEQTLGPIHRVSILLKALSFDFALAENRDKLRIGIVGNSEVASSLKEMDELLVAFESLSGFKVNGLSLQAQKLDLSKGFDLPKAVADQGLNLIYLTTGIDKELKPLLELCRAQKILTLANSPEYKEVGVAILVLMHNNKPKIMVHRAAALAQGARFDSRLLKLAESMD